MIAHHKAGLGTCWCCCGARFLLVVHCYCSIGVHFHRHLRRAWTGFSWKAFTHLWEFFKLSLASSVMLWYLIRCFNLFFNLTNHTLQLFLRSHCSFIIIMTVAVMN
uniref:Uncharacterized protein n=1 Tax=Nymphaea colorata TaxID=210225 RepID=A0A5K1A2S4_9MAGN